MTVTLTAWHRSDEALKNLVALSARGDTRAFALLYEHSARHVYGLALRVVRDPAGAEEVAHQAFVEVWRSASGFDAGRASALSWLLSITHRLAAHKVRTTQQGSREQDAATLYRLERELDDIAERATENDEPHNAEHCLVALTNLQRRILVLAYFQGCTSQQISRILDTPVSTVRTHMRDGLEQLRDCMGVQR